MSKKEILFEACKAGTFQVSCRHSKKKRAPQMDFLVDRYGEEVVKLPVPGLKR
jgi:hypothetical protein